MKIINIKSGDTTFSTYNGKFQYARLVTDTSETIASATLELLLKINYVNRDKISNYEEALIEYIDFNNKMIEAINKDTNLKKLQHHKDTSVKLWATDKFS